MALMHITMIDAHEIVVDEMRQDPACSAGDRERRRAARAPLPCSQLHLLRAVEQPVGPEQQEGDEQREDDGVAVRRHLRGQKGDDEDLERAEHIAAERARRRWSRSRR